ncbi:MAG: J domain-containing protein [Hyphomicrobiales bacterium]
MFTGTGSGKTVEVSIRMLDGATVRGAISLGQNVTSLDGMLSKPTPFLEFYSKDGQRKFVAKHQISYVEPVEPLKKPVLPNTTGSRFTDAYTILGVPRTCSFDDAKMAFHNLAKQYHPDTVSSIDLPPEVAAYMNDMFKQINTAFTELRSELQGQRFNAA